jgi:hypothetical protein
MDKDRSEPAKAAVEGQLERGVRHQRGPVEYEASLAQLRGCAERALEANRYIGNESNARFFEGYIRACQDLQRRLHGAPENG